MGSLCQRHTCSSRKKTGTKVTTYIDNGDTYALIDLSTLPYGITDRTTAEGKTEL